jgi:hydroxymethylglutaryl-CoA lyase
MTEYDYWKIFPRMPKKVTIGDITIRDGFQHEERTISTAAKIFYGEEMILAGCREIELTNLGNPEGIPQFRDAEQVLGYFRGDRFRKNCERRGITPADITFTAVTIREKAVDTAIELRKRGIGPDRILMMVSTDPEHHYANSGTTLSQYWKEVERCIQKAADAGIRMNGTVSTIWGSPITGATRMEDAVEFTKRFLELGASDIEHADHDGSASPAQVYRYYSMILDTRRSASPRHPFWRPCRRASAVSRLPWAVWAASRPTSSTTPPYAGRGSIITGIPVTWVSSRWRTFW